MKAGNGQTILTGEPCRTKDDCLKIIEALRLNATMQNYFELKKSLHQKHYFNILDSTGAVIGSSEMYESSSGRDTGVELVKTNARISEIEDLTA